MHWLITTEPPVKSSWTYDVLIAALGAAFQTDEPSFCSHGDDNPSEETDDKYINSKIFTMWNFNKYRKNNKAKKN